MNVRQATTNDAAQIAQLLLAMHRELEHIDSGAKLIQNPEPEAQRTILQHLADSRSIIFVLEEPENLIVGFIHGSIRSRQPFLEPRFYGHVSDIYIMPQYRGKGGAELLMNAIEDFFRSKGFSEIDTQVLCSNERALKLYKKLGLSEYRKRLRKELR